MKLNDELYNFLKWMAQIVLPAMGTLYFGLSSIWGLPYGEQVVGTITVLDAFLGAILGVSTAKYTGDGTLHIDTTRSDKDSYNLAFDTPLDKLPEKKSVVLKVQTR